MTFSKIKVSINAHFSSWLGADVTFWSLGWLSLVYTRRKTLRSLFHIKFNKLNYLDDRYLQNCDEPWYCRECCSTSFPFNPYLATKTSWLAYCFQFLWDKMLLCVRNPASGLLQISRKLKKWQRHHNFLHVIVILTCKMLLNAAKCQGCSFYHFWVIKRKPTGGKITQSPTQIRVNPFPTNFPLLYPLKASENLRFSDVFRGYRSGTLVGNGLRQYSQTCL